MEAYCVLYNPLASTGKGEKKARSLQSILTDKPVTFQSVLNIPDMKAYLDGLDSAITVILTGGDGTLSRFANGIGGNPTRDIYYFPAGTGNDFLLDIGKSRDCRPFLLNPYITDLPKIHFNGMTRVFINGVGYGIDGYVCEEGNRVREKTGKDINYTAAALKGLLYAYKTCSGTVTIDGFTKTYDHIWMTPTMLGRYFGGGMMCAPGQDRLNADKTVSLMVMRCPSKLRTLMLFPGIFKGNHVKNKKVVDIYQGHEIQVRFDRPTALQIDGEVYSGVQEYTVTTCVAESRKQVACNEAVANGIH